MSKFIYIQDSHIRGKNSENRIGDYYSDVMNKIKEVINLAKELKVKAILHGGDLYDSELVSNVMVDEFIDLVENSGIEWYILPGNHDCIGNNWELSKSTTLAHIFRRSKLINELNKLSLRSITHKGNYFKYIIQGFKYFHNIEQHIKNKGLVCEALNSPFKIAIIHALVTLKPLPFQAMHVVAKDIKTDFDVVLVAHNHHFWGIKEINGTKFVNVGCLGRRKIDEKDIKPSCLLIDTETKDLKIIELKCAKKGSEVFDLEKVKEIKQFEGEINNFIKSLSDVKIQGLDIRGMVEFIGKEKKVEQEIIKECITRVGGFENENR